MMEDQGKAAPELKVGAKYATAAKNLDISSIGDCIQYSWYNQAKRVAYTRTTRGW